MKITLKELEILVKNGFSPKIDTPTGFEEITNTYRKNSPGKHIVFTDFTELKCADDHLIFVDGIWTNAKHLIENQKINEKIIYKISNLSSQDWVDFTINASHHSYFHNGMIHHNSGKSLIIFLCIVFLIKNNLAKRILITVPTISLVSQLYGDFLRYCSYPRIKQFFESKVHLLYGGQEKFSNKPITISTFQSVINLPKEFLENQDAVFSDEVHLMSKASGQFIYENAINTSYRMGFTGTLQECLLDTLVLEGLIGAPFQIVTTSQLIERGQVSNLKIYNMILTYSKPLAKFISLLDYQDEYKLIVTNPTRMDIITDFISTLEKNTLVLFTRIETHGDVLAEELRKKNPGKQIIYLTGKNKSDEREASRITAEKDDNVIIVASYGIFATGVSINNLHNVILASPYRSKIKVLQSIGRGLRLHSDKIICSIYDFVDSAKYNNKNNYFLDHFFSRYELYQKENFKTEFIKIPREII